MCPPQNSNHLRSESRAIIALARGRLDLENKFFPNKITQSPTYTTFTNFQEGVSLAIRGGDVSTHSLNPDRVLYFRSTSTRQIWGSTHRIFCIFVCSVKGLYRWLIKQSGNVFLGIVSRVGCRVCQIFTLDFMSDQYLQGKCKGVSPGKFRCHEDGHNQQTLYSFLFTWYKTAMLGRKSRTGARPTKGIHNFKW